MRYVTRAEVTSVFASGGSQMGRRHEDYANIMLMFEGGLIGVIEVNWLTPQASRSSPRARRLWGDWMAESPGPVKIRLLKLTCSQKYVEADYIGQTVDVASSTLLDLDPTNLYHREFGPQA